MFKLIPRSRRKGRKPDTVPWHGVMYHFHSEIIMTSRIFLQTRIFLFPVVSMSLFNLSHCVLVLVFILPPVIVVFLLLSLHVVHLVDLGLELVLLHQVFHDLSLQRLKSSLDAARHLVEERVCTGRDGEGRRERGKEREKEGE